jgi:hypothetical protein
LTERFAALVAVPEFHKGEEWDDTFRSNRPLLCHWRIYAVGRFLAGAKVELIVQDMQNRSWFKYMYKDPHQHRNRIYKPAAAPGVVSDCPWCNYFKRKRLEDARIGARANAIGLFCYSIVL